MSYTVTSLPRVQGHHRPVRRESHAVQEVPGDGCQLGAGGGVVEPRVATCDGNLSPVGGRRDGDDRPVVDGRCDPLPGQSEPKHRAPVRSSREQRSDREVASWWLERCPGATLCGVHVDQWFLAASERGNGATELDTRHVGAQAWTVGNGVEALIHGASYFGRLREAIESAAAGDLVLFTDWRGDPDERLTDAVDVSGALNAAAGRGVIVRGLVWAFAPRPLPFQRTGEPPSRRVGRRGGRAVPARHACQAGRLTSSEVRRRPLRGPPRARCRVRRRHRPVSQPPRRSAPPRRPAGTEDGRRLRSDAAVA